MLRRTGRVFLCMTTLYLIYGSCGHYSDYHEWNVCAYPAKEMAEAHMRLAQDRADELERTQEERGELAWDQPKEPNLYDPDMSWDNGGVSYKVCEIELRDTLPVIIS
jgi:hypothetical protein